MLPAHECLDPGDAPVPQDDDRLIEERELAALDRVPQVLVNVAMPKRGHVELRVERARRRPRPRRRAARNATSALRSNSSAPSSGAAFEMPMLPLAMNSFSCAMSGDVKRRARRSLTCAKWRPSLMSSSRMPKRVPSSRAAESEDRRHVFTRVAAACEQQLEFLVIRTDAAGAKVVELQQDDAQGQLQAGARAPARARHDPGTAPGLRGR
jgi:hypothetical protein